VAYSGKRSGVKGGAAKRSRVLPVHNSGNPRKPGKNAGRNKDLLKKEKLKINKKYKGKKKTK
jgi:hypothetical protein